MPEELSQEHQKLLENLNVEENDAIFIINPPTGQFLDANEKACRNLKYTKEELLSMKVMDIEAIIPTDFSWEKHVQVIKKEGKGVVIGKHKRKDGSTFLVQVNVHYISQKDKDYMVALVRVVE